MQTLKKPGPFGVPIYGYALGGLIFLGALFYFLKRGSSTTAKTSTTGASASPAFDTSAQSSQPPVPFPTGGNQNSGQTVTPPSQMISLKNPFTSGARVGKVPMYTAPTPDESTIGVLVTPGTQVRETGPGIYDRGNQFNFYPVDYQGQSYYVAEPNAGFVQTMFMQPGPITTPTNGVAPWMGQTIHPG